MTIPLLLPVLLTLSTPQIIFDPPAIRGSMPRDMAQSSIKKRLVQVRACYKNAPSPLPKKLTARLVVGADGRVKVVRFDPPKKHQVLKNCLRKELLQLRFPKTCGGITIIDQPLRLRLPPKKKPPPKPVSAPSAETPVSLYVKPQ